MLNHDDNCCKLGGGDYCRGDECGTPLPPTFTLEQVNALVESIAKAIETKQWHPGGAKGAINPSMAAKLVREFIK